MNLLDLVRSLKVLLSAPGRLVLTLLGIVIGSAAIVLVMGLLEGGKRALVQANQGATGSDLIVVRDKALPERERVRARPELSRADARAVSRMRTTTGRSVHAEARHETRASVGSRDKRVSVVSGDPSIASLYRLSLKQGRFLLNSDLAARRRVCVIGHEVHQELFGGGAPGAVSIEGTRFQVVGVLKKKPMIGSTTGTHIWDRKVLLPETTFDLYFAPDHSVARVLIGGREDSIRAARRSSAAVSTPPSLGVPLPTARAAITRLISARHAGAKNFELDDAAGRAQEQLIVSVIELLLVATGALALFVGGINVMNVMFVRVSERRREIGLRRALGATRGSILALFLAESTLLAAFGGLIGVALGSALTALAATAMAQVFNGFPLVIPGLALALGTGLALSVGVLSGLLPAWHAARLNPVAALR